MSNIEIEECLSFLRSELEGEGTEKEKLQIALCNAQNSLQEWIEKHYNRSEWKHTRSQLIQEILK